MALFLLSIIYQTDYPLYICSFVVTLERGKLYFQIQKLRAHSLETKIDERSDMTFHVEINRSQIRKTNNYSKSFENVSSLFRPSSYVTLTVLNINDAKTLFNLQKLQRKIIGMDFTRSVEQ